jgi:RimJ/RimL family protein N-acetyltransferase
LKLVYSDQALELYEYTPTLFRLFPFYMKKVYFSTKIKLFSQIALWGGYRIYYLKERNDYIGYCLILTAKSPHYFFAGKHDVIVGPYYIDKKYRGKGYSNILLNYVLNESGITFENAYDYIELNNIPSIKASEKNGFKLIMRININDKSHKMVADSDGAYGVYKLCSQVRMNK